MRISRPAVVDYGYLLFALVSTAAGASTSHAPGTSPKALPIGAKGAEHLRETTYSVPNGSYYIKRYNGTVTEKAAAKFAKAVKAYIPITVINPTSGDMCLQASYTDLGDPLEIPSFICDNETESVRLPVPANSSVQYGSFLPFGDRVHYNGRIQAFFNCNSNCTKCPGEDKPRHTLVEWKYGNDSSNPIFETEAWWINLSNVDGLNMNLNYTVFDSKGKVCGTPRGCNVAGEDLIKTCPTERYWNINGTQGCESDCKATGLHRHCCTGDFSSRNPLTCPKSSSFLKELCLDAYSSPFDDAGSVDHCQKISGVRMSFWGYNKASMQSLNAMT